MASWRPPGSILEASGLPFGGSGPDFRRLWTSYLEPRTPRTPKNLQKQKLHHKVARPPKGGWAAVISPVGLQSAAHRRCGHGVLDHNHIVLKKSFRLVTEGQALDVRLKFFVRLLGPYLFLSPGWGGTTADLAPRNGILSSCAFFSRFFALPNCDLNLASKKHRKKCENQ